VLTPSSSPTKESSRDGENRRHRPCLLRLRSSSDVSSGHSAFADAEDLHIVSVCITVLASKARAPRPLLEQRRPLERPWRASRLKTASVQWPVSRKRPGRASRHKTMGWTSRQETTPRRRLGHLSRGCRAHSWVQISGLVGSAATVWWYSSCPLQGIHHLVGVVLLPDGRVAVAPSGS
jgi:hypothetical protein